MNNLSKWLRLLSKISIVFAVVIPIANLIVKPEFKMIMAKMQGLVDTYMVSRTMMFVMVVNVLFNVFLFLGAAAVFAALAQILDKKQEQ